MKTANDADPHRLPRPEQLDTLTQDQLVACVLHLAMEVSVLRERLGTHETLLEAAGVLTRDQVDTHVPEGDDAARRSAERNALIANIIDKLR
ncbi:MAG: hypothetical protein AAF545_03955 [Pseudomonadota bacterium]